jgi:hypothetical protein
MLSGMLEMKISSITPKNFKYVLSPLLVTALLTGNAYAVPTVPASQEVAQFPQFSATTKFHVDNNLPFPVRVRAIRDGRSDINQTLNPGGSFQGNIDRRAGVRIVVYAPGDCSDVEIMPSSYARVYSTKTFRIQENGIKRVVADQVDPWSRVAGAVVTGVALYYAPEYGPTILSAAGVKEAKLASCTDSLTSLSCLNRIVSYAEDLRRQYGDNSVAYNQCLREARERAETILAETIPVTGERFDKPGNNGSVSCSTFCGAANVNNQPVWGDRIGLNVGSEQPVGEAGVCQCAQSSALFIKEGNNGTVNCDTFCQGSEWGQVGRCVACFDNENNVGGDCNYLPGFLGGSELTCTCVQ